jgi:hypothetical protein
MTDPAWQRPTDAQIASAVRDIQAGHAARDEEEAWRRMASALQEAGRQAAATGALLEAALEGMITATAALTAAAREFAAALRSVKDQRDAERRRWERSGDA